jgi:hypothetical protein
MDKFIEGLLLSGNAYDENENFIKNIYQVIPYINKTLRQTFFGKLKIN